MVGETPEDPSKITVRREGEQLKLDVGGQSFDVEAYVGQKHGSGYRIVMQEGQDYQELLGDAFQQTSAKLRDGGVKTYMRLNDDLLQDQITELDVMRVEIATEKQTEAELLDPLANLLNQVQNPDMDEGLEQEFWHEVEEIKAAERKEEAQQKFEEHYAQRERADSGLATTEDMTPKPKQEQEASTGIKEMGDTPSAESIEAVKREAQVSKAAAEERAIKQAEREAIIEENVKGSIGRTLQTQHSALENQVDAVYAKINEKIEQNPALQERLSNMAPEAKEDVLKQGVGGFIGKQDNIESLAEGFVNRVTTIAGVGKPSSALGQEQETPPNPLGQQTSTPALQRTDSLGPDQMQYDAMPAPPSQNQQEAQQQTPLEGKYITKGAVENTLYRGDINPEAIGKIETRLQDEPSLKNRLDSMSPEGRADLLKLASANISKEAGQSKDADRIADSFIENVTAKLDERDAAKQKMTETQQSNIPVQEPAPKMSQKETEKRVKSAVKKQLPDLLVEAQGNILLMLDQGVANGEIGMYGGMKLEEAAKKLEEEQVHKDGTREASVIDKAVKSIADTIDKKIREESGGSLQGMSSEVRSNLEKEVRDQLKNAVQEVVDSANEIAAYNNIEFQNYDLAAKSKVISQVAPEQASIKENAAGNKVSKESSAAKITEAVDKALDETVGKSRKQEQIKDTIKTVGKAALSIPEKILREAKNIGDALEEKVGKITKGKGEGVSSSTARAEGHEKEQKDKANKEKGK